MGLLKAPTNNILKLSTLIRPQRLALTKKITILPKGIRIRKHKIRLLPGSRQSPKIFPLRYST
jgi:hypothetical protein